ncbi:MAG: permease prefix domain 1-containing protein [Acidobacteriota bacterium]
MSTEEKLIEKILASSGIVSARRRREVARELRAHLEDAIEEARAAGHNEAEIEELVLLRFGEPQEVAEQFADVYCAERFMAYFIYCFLLVVGSLVVVSAFVGTVQISLAVGMGYGAAWAFPRGHLVWEIALLTGLTLGYLSLYFVERLFNRLRLVKAFLLMVPIFTLVSVGLEIWWSGSGIAHGVAFCCAVFVRALEIYCPRIWWKLTGLALFFLMLGLLVLGSFMRTQGTSVWMMVSVFCLTIALSCQFMISLVAIFDRHILSRDLV